MQEELCNTVKGLTEAFVDPANTVKFVSAFFTELSRTWDGIDIFRINKYDRLVRRVLEGLYNTLAAHSWNPEHIALANAMLIEGPYNTRAVPPFPHSLTMHVNDVIIDSIDKAAEKAPEDMEGTTIKKGDSVFYFEKSETDEQKISDEKILSSDENDDDVKDDAMDTEDDVTSKNEDIRVVPRHVLPKLIEPFVHCVAYGTDKTLYAEISKKIFTPLSYDTEWPHIMRDTEAIRKEIMAFEAKAEAERVAAMEAEKKKKRAPARQLFSQRLMALAMIMHEAKKTGGVEPGPEDIPSVNELVDILREKYSQDKRRPRTKLTPGGLKRRRKAHKKRNMDKKRKRFYSSINK